MGGGAVSTPLPVGPLTPYVTPAALKQAPTGVDFSDIPAGGIRRGVTQEQKTAELANICARATALVDKCCKQPLRATIDPLPLYGPGAPRVYVPRGRGDQPATLIMTRWPVLEVVSVQYSKNCLPYNWSTVPAGLAVPAHPPAGLYGSSAPAAAGEGGQAIKLAAGYIDWRYGPEGYAILTEYVNGWPHCGLTAAADEDATELQVDDCTGWVITPVFPGAATGATGTVYDAGGQEVIQVTAASAASGPGTLTLAAPLANAHDAGVMVSTLPQSVEWAAMLFAIATALERGATAMKLPEVPGGRIAQSAGQDPSSGNPAKWAKDILCGTFDRII
jgi:hypothetical protein